MELILPLSNFDDICKITQSLLLQSDGSLLLKSIAVDDAGLYECSVENETAYVDRVNLTVRSEYNFLVTHFGIIWLRNLYFRLNQVQELPLY